MRGIDIDGGGGGVVAAFDLWWGWGTSAKGCQRGI